MTTLKHLIDRGKAIRGVKVRIAGDMTIYIVSHADKENENVYLEGNEAESFSPSLLVVYPNREYKDNIDALEQFSLFAKTLMSQGFKRKEIHGMLDFALDELEEQTARLMS